MINLPQTYLLHDDRFKDNCHKRIDQLYELNKKSDDPILLEVVIQEQTDTKRSKERRHIFALIGDIIKAVQCEKALLGLNLTDQLPRPIMCEQSNP